MTRPLFSVSNHHVDGCGRPPEVDGDLPRTYVGYFANRFGEQCIYTYDHDTGAATLRMGDAGWEVSHVVANGVVEGLILNESEGAWLRACWMATGGIRARAGLH